VSTSGLPFYENLHKSGDSKTVTVKLEKAVRFVLSGKIHMFPAVVKVTIYLLLVLIDQTGNSICSTN